MIRRGMVTAQRTKRLTLLASILGSSIVFIDGTVVNVALPAISDDLDAGLAGQQWVAEAYLLTLASLLLVGGSLGDLFGRRRVLALGSQRSGRPRCCAPWPRRSKCSLPPGRSRVRPARSLCPAPWRS